MVFLKNLYISNGHSHFISPFSLFSPFSNEQGGNEREREGGGGGEDGGEKLISPKKELAPSGAIFVKKKS